MMIVFFSNVLNHHQVALCDELYRQSDGEFRFVETNCLNQARQSMGFRQFERPYVLRTNDSTAVAEAKQLALTADIAIMGAESFDYLKLRINSGKGVTFSYSERWLKQGLKNIASPNLLKLIRLYISKGRKRKWYMLAASGYLANDLYRIGIFRNRIFKWGYFPKYSKDLTLTRTDNQPIKILWTGRFIDWKRPDIIIRLAEKLAANDYDFEFTMIGDGVMADAIKSMINSQPQIADRIKLKGNLPNDEVLSEMASSDIYCFTSTRREGWGAVLGEAMSTGCCPVASSEAGATPFLINDKKNGLVFQTDNIDDLYAKVTYLIENPTERQKLGQAARETMLNEWNAATAATEFISLAKLKLNDRDEITPESNRPASPAHPIIRACSPIFVKNRAVRH